MCGREEASSTNLITSEVKAAPADAADAAVPSNEQKEEMLRPHFVWNHPNLFVLFIRLVVVLRVCMSVCRSVRRSVGRPGLSASHLKL